MIITMDKKKIVVARVASIFLMAAVVTADIGATIGGSATVTSMAVHTACSPTDFKETCEKLLIQANSTDPKDLIKFAFHAAVENIGDVLKNSPLLKEAAANPKTKGACDVCQEVLETALDDLRRSVDNVGVLDFSKAHEYVEDIKTWLSAVIANQETCIDAFAETNTETSGKMRNVLGKARELSSNGLAMVSEISKLVRMTSFLHGRKLLAREPPQFAKPRLQQASRVNLQPDLVVAKDGSGDFKTITEAIATLPEKNNDSVVIHIKAGVYKEQVMIPKRINHITLVGDGPTKTIITGNKCVAGGYTTYKSATVGVDGEDFLAMNLGIENTAGPSGSQAVALRVSGDKAIFYNCHFNGYQDTLYAHTYRQFYRDCSFSGTVDFIFGHSLSLFQNCKFTILKPGPNQACMLTADGRTDQHSLGGLIIQNGNIVAEPAFLATKPAIKAFLGRPWKEYSTAIIMQSYIEGFIDPAGWSPWAGNFALDTCYFAEFNNRGPGTKNLTGRVKWKGIKKLNHNQAQRWTGGTVFAGDEWIRKSGVPYVPTFIKV